MREVLSWTKMLDAETSKLLLKIYTTPEHPGSFSSATVLQKILNSQYDKFVKLTDIQDWLSKQRVYNIHQRAVNKFDRNPIIVKYIDDQWQADLFFMPNLASANDKIPGGLICIDVLSRHVWGELIKNKSGPEVTRAMSVILKRAASNRRKPENLHTDAVPNFSMCISKN